MNSLFNKHICDQMALHGHIVLTETSYIDLITFISISSDKTTDKHQLHMTHFTVDKQNW